MTRRWEWCLVLPSVDGLFAWSISHLEDIPCAKASWIFPPEHKQFALKPACLFFRRREVPGFQLQTANICVVGLSFSRSLLELVSSLITRLLTCESPGELSTRQSVSQTNKHSKEHWRAKLPTNLLRLYLLPALEHALLTWQPLSGSRAVERYM